MEGLPVADLVWDAVVFDVPVGWGGHDQRDTLAGRLRHGAAICEVDPRLRRRCPHAVMEGLYPTRAEVEARSARCV